MRVLAAAKINLHLRVGPRRDDGFHSLSSWMATVGLFDTLDFERARREGCALRCDRADLATDQTNLVVRSAASLADAMGRSPARTANDRGAEATLHKRIPAGAGLGGGSADAARTLLALNRLWELDWPINRLAPLAAGLGSDVPFFLHGPSAWCRGRGEEVAPIPAPACRWAVLLLPAIHMPTPAVYRRFDDMRLGSQSAIDAMPPWPAWVKLQARDLLAELVNDLEAPAFAIEPGLGLLRTDAEKATGRPVRMSGSGSSLFTLFDERGEAEAAARRLGESLGVKALAVEVAPTIDDDLSV